MSWGPLSWKNGVPPEVGPARHCFSVRSTADFRQRVEHETQAAERFRFRYGIAVAPVESSSDPLSQLANVSDRVAQWG